MRRSRIDDYIREQENISEISRESIEALQLCKLNALLQREKERAGFYKELPVSLQKLEELSSLPFTKDEELAEQGGSMLLTSQREVQRVLSDATSGTTHSAKRVFYTQRDCENTVKLFMAGLGELVFPGSCTMICMPFSGPFGLGELIAEAICRLGARPLKLGSSLSYGELEAVLRLEKPDSYVGMPTALLSMLRYCGKGSLKRALVSGDACPDTLLALCENILEFPLFPHYGSREMALGGAICCQAHEGMHLRENNVIAEIIDAQGNTLPRGEWGELVITTIGMEAQPLIRYRTGDYTRILPERCACGSVVTRLDSVRRLGDAGEMAGLDEKLFSIPSLVDYRAWRDGGGLHIKALGMEGLREKLIKEQCPQAAEIEIRSVQAGDRALYEGKRKLEKA